MGIVFSLIFILVLFLLCRRRLRQKQQQKKALNETAAMPLIGQMEVVVGGIASSPEHEYEKLNYELVANNKINTNNKITTATKLNSLGRACKLASTESLDDDGYLKNNDQRDFNDDGYIKNNESKNIAEKEDVDNDGYLRNNDQRRLNPENDRYLNMSRISLNRDFNLTSNISKKPSLTSSTPKNGSLQR